MRLNRLGFYAALAATIALAPTLAIAGETDRDGGAKIFRLGMNPVADRDGGATVKTLAGDGDVDADTLLVRGWCGRGGWGGWGWGGRVGWGGYCGSFYRPSYSCWSPRFYGGYYGGFCGTSYYTPYVSYFPSYSYSYSYYQPSFCAPSAYYYNYGYSPLISYGYSPIAGLRVSTPAVNLSLQGYTARYPTYSLTPNTVPIPRTIQPDAYEAPRSIPNEGNYPYNGGPANPVPMPGVEPNPMGAPAKSAPLEGRVVSLQGGQASSKSKYTYAAYGEKPAIPGKLAKDPDTLLVKRAQQGK